MSGAIRDKSARNCAFDKTSSVLKMSFATTTCRKLSSMHLNSSLIFRKLCPMESIKVESRDLFAHGANRREAARIDVAARVLQTETAPMRSAWTSHPRHATRTYDVNSTSRLIQVSSFPGVFLTPPFVPAAAYTECITFVSVFLKNESEMNKATKEMFYVFSLLADFKICVFCGGGRALNMARVLPIFYAVASEINF